MKKNMMKEVRLRISVRSLVILGLVSILMLTAIAATPTLIQATLSPDITVKYNGAVQSMTDISGTVVYPISYNGTTYVPLRAVGNMLGIGVEWEGSTKTVLLGNTSGEARLVDVCEKRTGDGFFGYTYGDRMNSTIELPGGDSTRTFNSAIRIDSPGPVKKAGVFRLNGTYSTMSTTFNGQYSGDRDGGFTLRIYDHDKELLLAERSLQAGQFVEVNDIDLTGVKNLRFEALGPFFASNDSIAYFLDPIVK